jgi:histidinol phosphatase-like enzyme
LHYDFIIKEKSFMIGNSACDLEFADNLGVRGILLDPTYTVIGDKHHSVIRNFSEVLGIVLESL